jgi:hypothetical protein
MPVSGGAVDVAGAPFDGAGAAPEGSGTEESGTGESGAEDGAGAADDGAEEGGTDGAGPPQPANPSASSRVAVSSTGKIGNSVRNLCGTAGD